MTDTIPYELAAWGFAIIVAALWLVIIEHVWF